jgi:hypothetical protein
MFKRKKCRCKAHGARDTVKTTPGRRKNLIETTPEPF